MSRFADLVNRIALCGGEVETGRTLVGDYIVVSVDRKRSKAGEALGACIGMVTFKGRWTSDAVGNNAGKQMFAVPEASGSRGGGLYIAVMEKAVANALLAGVQKDYANQSSGWVVEDIKVITIDADLVRDWVENADRWSYSPATEETMGGLLLA